MASTNQDNKSNNIDIQKMVEFVKKNARYFVAGALFVVLLLILVKFTGNGTGNADDNNVAVTETVVTEEAYAVSYTHLDVYKRQIPGCSREQSWKISGTAGWMQRMRK